MKLPLILTAFLLVTQAGRTQTRTSAQEAAAEKEIFAAMNAATVQWNKGDLDAYMSLYDHDATMMLAAGRVGLDSIRGMYVRYYFPGGHPKQELAYDTYQLTLLGKDFALLTGRFILKANDKYPERKGTFSLTMVHRKDGWKILHDHSG
jgi:ketosteroid isomerase-like protein